MSNSPPPEPKEEKKHYSRRFSVPTSFILTNSAAATKKSDSTLVTEDWAALDEYFYRVCRSGLVRDILKPPNLFSKAFTGKEFLTVALSGQWVDDKYSAVVLGTKLLEGGIIQHYKETKSFHDSDDLLYRFWYDNPNYYNGPAVQIVLKEQPEPIISGTLLQLSTHSSLFGSYAILSSNRKKFYVFRSFSDVVPRLIIDIKSEENSPKVRISEQVLKHLKDTKYRFTLEVETNEVSYTFCTKTAEELTSWVDAFVAEGAIYIKPKIKATSILADIIDPNIEHQVNNPSNTDTILPLTTVLENTVYRHAFRTYLQTQMAVENVNFIEGTQHLMLVDGEAVRKRVCEFLYDKFIKADAAQAINIPANLRKKIRSALDNGDVSNDVWYEALDTVYKLLESDLYARFVKSHEYQSMIKQKVQQELISGTFKTTAWINDGSYKSVQVDILKAENLDDADNVFCTVTVDLKSYRTEAKKDTNDPQFLESFHFPLLITTRCVAIELYNSNLFSSDAFLGQAIIPLSDAENRSEPRWYDLLARSKEDTVSGRINVSLTLSKDEISSDDLNNKKLIIKDHNTGLLAGLRSGATKNRNRFIADGFDLDLTYITDRIIAMCFPAQSVLQGTYRNPMTQVIEFLNLRHKNCYKVYNLSEKTYPSECFENRVETYPFERHLPPPFNFIPMFCRSCQIWLDQHPQNIIVVHCNSGKGRTGFMISAYLLYTNSCVDVKSATEKFAVARTKDKTPISQPSQIRYLNYFITYLKIERRQESPLPERTLLIREIRVMNLPQSRHDGLNISFSCDNQKMSTRNRFPKGPEKTYLDNNTTMLSFRFSSSGPVVHEDFRINFSQYGVFGSTHLFFAVLNTRFLPIASVVLKQFELDNAQSFEDTLKIELIYEDFSGKIDRSVSLNEPGII